MKLKFDSYRIGQFLFGFAFLVAGVYRLTNPLAARMEVDLFHFPFWIARVMAVLEVVFGFMLLCNLRPKIAFTGMASMLFFILLISLKEYSFFLFSNIKELLVIDPTMTDFFLHSVYLLIIIFVYLKKPNI